MSKKTAIAAALICALVGSSNAMGRIRAASGMEKIIAAFNNNRKYLNVDTKKGAEAGIACAEIILLDWQALYTTAILSLPLNERPDVELESFNEAVETANSDLNDVFEQMRPGISNAIRKKLNEFRQKDGPDKAPPLPSALTIDDPQESLFAENMRFCQNPAFIAAVNGEVPLADGSQIVPRYVDVEVADTGNFNGVPVIKTSIGSGQDVTPGTHVEKQLQVKTYSNWMKVIKSR